jgi:hypothetical protein
VFTALQALQQVLDHPKLEAMSPAMQSMQIRKALKIHRLFIGFWPTCVLDVGGNESQRDAENFHYERNERARKNGILDVRFISRGS